MTDATEEDVEDQLDGDEELDEDGEAGQGGAKKSGRKKLLLIALPVLLIIGLGAGAFLTGLADPLLGKGEEHAEESEEIPVAGTAFYFDLPQMLVNLNTPGRRSSFLKIVVSLELAKQQDEERLKEAMPRIVDNFQVYLRELRVEDLRGSAGLYRLREELLFRVNTAVHPARVTDVLFKEMLVQ